MAAWPFSSCIQHLGHGWRAVMSPGLASLVVNLHFHHGLITPSLLSIRVTDCSEQGLFTAVPLSFVAFCPKANDDDLHISFYFLFPFHLASPLLSRFCPISSCLLALHNWHPLGDTDSSSIRLSCLYGLETYHHQSGPIRQPEAPVLTQQRGKFTGLQTHKIIMD